MTIVNKIDFWDCDPNVEILTHTDIDEAIQAHLGERIAQEFNAEDIETENWDTIEVCGFSRKKVSDKDIVALQDLALTCIQEVLSETYDGEDGHEIPDEARPLAKNLVETYISNYTPWVCDLVETRTINIEEWVNLK